jgi:small subunit ribosomal protein S9
LLATFADDGLPLQVLFPLIFAGLLGAVDVEATVSGGGFSGQAGAVRWGIAWSLRSFVDTETVERMRLGKNASCAAVQAILYRCAGRAPVY